MDSKKYKYSYEKRKSMIVCQGKRKIGIPICYEIHFPEVVRMMEISKPVLLLNIIGTGMYHELQYEQWTTLAKARAIENEVFVLGCSHFDGEIPLAYAYLPSGNCICEKKREYGAFVVEIDLCFLLLTTCILSIGIQKRKEENNE